MELLFMTPVFKDMLWGGTRLREIYGYEIPTETTGECWAVSAHPNGDCRIDGGTFDGMHLSQLWKEQPQLFGGDGSGVFPLLVKLIDARDDLSIQVHPDDTYAAEHENGSLGKTECWYILDCDQGATIVVGHKARDAKEMEEMISGGRWQDFIREVPIKKGDFFQIEPGCLHAIKKGTLVFETQQSSDITYRVYDYDRLSEGKPRQLHIKQSLDTITAPFVARETESEVTELPGAVKTHLVTCKFYSVDKFEIRGCFDYEFPNPITLASVVEGEGKIDGRFLEKGQHFIIPKGYGSCRMEGNMTVICSNPE